MSKPEPKDKVSSEILPFTKQCEDADTVPVSEGDKSTEDKMLLCSDCSSPPIQSAKCSRKPIKPMQDLQLQSIRKLCKFLMSLQSRSFQLEQTNYF